MPDAASLSVLRDLATLTWVALALGVLGFRLWHVFRPVAALEPGPGRWVDVRAFSAADGVVVAAISMVLLFGLNGAPSGGGEPVEEAELTTEGLFTNAVFMLSLWAILLVYLQLVRGMSWGRVFGLDRVRIERAVGLGLLLLIPVVITVNVTAYGMGLWLETFWELEPQAAVQAFSADAQPGVRVMMVLFAVVIAPLVEETIFRGFIYPVFKKYTDGLYAAVCSSLLFGLVHLHVGSLVPLVLLALILCFVYERSGSLIVPMVIHAGFNAISLIGLLIFQEVQP